MKTLIGMLAIIAGLTLPQLAAALEAPDALVKRVSTEILAIAKTDAEIQAGNDKRLNELIDAKILPYVDFQRMTALAVGRGWRNATPAQKTRLISEFRALLVHIYAGAIAQIRDEEMRFKPMRGKPSDSEVVVRSVVMRSRGEPIQLDYRLEKRADGWKIYDFNILGAWLVQTYRSSFASELGRGGIDGLITALSDKNRQLKSQRAGK